MRLPLKLQIMVPLLVVAVVSLLVAGVFSARLVATRTRHSIEVHLQGVVRALTTSNYPLSESVLRQMKSLSGADFVVIDDGGHQIGASIAPDVRAIPAEEVLFDLEDVVLGRQITVAGRNFFHSAVQLPPRSDTAAAVTLHILFPREQYDAAWRSAFLPPLVVAIMAVVAVVVVTHWIASRISGSLVRLRQGVQCLAERKFSVLEVPPRDDEVRDLALSINQTARKLDEYEQHVRQTEQVRTMYLLGAGLAHEMRNATTGCRLALDLHAERCAAFQTADESLSIAKNQLQLMEHRLQRFMQWGSKPTELKGVEVELGGIVEDVLPQMSPAARHAGVRMDWQRSEVPVYVLAHRESLTMVLVNLLQNAIEAAHKQSTSDDWPAEVYVTLSQDTEGYATLAVRDTGAGLDATVSERLFEPFVTSKPEGVGLGLAVASRVAAAAGGVLEWKRVDRYTEFSLRLPLAHEFSNGKE